ncbi:MAG: methyltransferase domain-containing protein [Pseudomonadota bacterium]
MTTFEGHFAANYDGEIADFWQSVLEPLATGSVVVDLATGNGAVALLAAAWARGEGVDLAITGVDSATIGKEQVRSARPELGSDLDDIALVGNTPLEATGLATASVDLVTSQYGYEYGDTAAGSIETARILKPGGRLAMVLHNTESAILKQAHEGLAQVAFCLDEERMLSLAQRMVKMFRALKAGGQGPGGLHWSPGALKVREALIDASERIEKRANTPVARSTDAGFIQFFLPSVMQLAERAREFDTATLEGAWRSIEAETETYRHRMADLRSAALDEAGIARVASELETAGLEDIVYTPLIYRQVTLIGWKLTANKA